MKGGGGIFNEIDSGMITEWKAVELMGHYVNLFSVRFGNLKLYYIR